MPVIAYLANSFPSITEPYVADEILELRARGLTVIPCSIRKPLVEEDLNDWIAQTVYLQPPRVTIALQAVWLCLREFGSLRRFLSRILLHGKESPTRRLRALAHTFIGAYFAVSLKKSRVQHIHVHHGYFGSWVAMAAAQLLGIDFSMTLHGSDLLLHPAYLDLKLGLCQFCVTISEFNRRHILLRYPSVDPNKIMVHRLGVDCSAKRRSPIQERQELFRIFTAGRLQQVKDHAFLIRACHALKERGLNFSCRIAGEGPERQSLERLIRDLDVQGQVRLLGQLSRAEIQQKYETADLVVLTSRSEGIPLVLMEAMAQQKLVLAPEITGIPELIHHGRTGFLYRPGSLDEFVTQIEIIREKRGDLGGVSAAAREHIKLHFNRPANVAAFCDRLIASLELTQNHPDHSVTTQRILYENPILQ